ncbi:hypothetical protein FB565_003002 [Actinoplanes lutulentus]|uniref:HNH endonuclease n=1 Tax=Actinoplanes lutulentus TaxID=1287878 RepID=A0A327Z2U8_9ACTN|nr:HNH endonuclease [Actinoplanes lutulentus]MBB2943289.1 hypothetical protein [Actinoplanes lutulentus]RAK28348.1 HNH endonuclease [Actinoplanes lutulentus]
MTAFDEDHILRELVRLVGSEDCDLIARCSRGGKISAKDAKHFKALRERLAGIGHDVVEQYIGREPSMAVFTSDVPQGAKPVDAMWCCVFPAEAKNPDLGLHIALAVSAEGVDLMLRIGAGVAPSPLQERLRTLPGYDREGLRRLLPKYGLGRENDLADLDEWLEKASPGAAISRHVRADELDYFGYEIGQEMRHLAIVSMVFMLWYCYEEDEAATGTEAPRIRTTVQRIVRSTEKARRVKDLHQYACQVCGLQIVTPAGRYAEAAHIRALGRPHNGPDAKANILCLCPNHHVMFDTGAIYIDDDGTVRDTDDHAPVGVLHQVPEHRIDAVQLAYHREQHAR